MRHTILETSRGKQSGCVPTSVILCQLSKAGPEEDVMTFCTWLQCWDEDDYSKRAGRVHGHYFDNLQDAIDDYHERADMHYKATGYNVTALETPIHSFED